MFDYFDIQLKSDKWIIGEYYLAFVNNEHYSYNMFRNLCFYQYNIIKCSKLICTNNMYIIIIGNI